MGTIDIVVTAEGKVVADGYTKVVQPSVSGTVRSINVRDGEFVKEGSLLMELDTKMPTADLTAVREKIAQAQAELARLRAERAGKAATYVRDIAPDKRATQEALRQSRQEIFAYRLSEATAAVEEKKRAAEAIRASLDGFELREKVASEKEERARKYVDVAIPRFQYLQWKDELLIIQRELATNRKTYQMYLNQLEEAKRKLSIVTSENQAAILNDINEREALVTQLESELSKAEKRVSDNRVTAPIDGYIQKVYITTLGASVAATDSIVAIVPKDAPLIIEAFLPNGDKGFVRRGQSADIKLDAFPFQKYGKLRGTLTWISPDAEELSNASRPFVSPVSLLRNAGSQVPQLVYRMKIKPQGANGQLKLESGMSVKVDVFTDTRRIVDFFLFPVVEAAEDALRVR